MQVIDMQRTQAEKDAAKKRYEAAPTEAGPDYPYGMTLNLGAEELAKLGISDLPKVGDELHFGGVAKVTRVSQSASEGGDDHKGVELQITHMGIDDNDGDEAEASPANKLYPGK